MSASPSVYFSLHFIQKLLPLIHWEPWPLAHQLPFHHRTLSWVGSTSTCMNTQHPVPSIPPQPTSPPPVFVSSCSFWSHPPPFWDHQEELHFYPFHHKESPTTKSRNRTLLPQKPPIAPYPEITTIPTSNTRDFIDPFVRLRKFPSISICITNVYTFIGFLYEMIIIVFLLYLLICGLHG